ncbi:hypothetical protein, partial [Enterococcus faecalis]|uniref:hypothetical protein n=1 Tax=Enterococcus faecalis TaxID=1351 RepID=UPI0040418431
SHPFLLNCQFSKLRHSYNIQKRTKCHKKMLFHKKIITKKKQEVSQFLADFLFFFCNNFFMKKHFFKTFCSFLYRIAMEQFRKLTIE